MFPNFSFYIQVSRQGTKLVKVMVYGKNMIWSQNHTLTGWNETWWFPESDG